MLGLVIHVGTETVAVPVRAVVEVVPAVRLHVAAGTPPWVAGLARYRGGVVPVIDLVRVATGHPCPDRLSSRIVILDAPLADGVFRLGLLAERVDDLTEVPKFHAEHAYLPEPESDRPSLGPVVNVATGVIRLPDLQALAGLAFRLPGLAAVRES